MPKLIRTRTAFLLAFGLIWAAGLVPALWVTAAFVAGGDWFAWPAGVLVLTLAGLGGLSLHETLQRNPLGLR